jgi:alginate O-acetyltransferase complex protein AlgI
MIVLAFSLQIYFDFSAYSDIAIGLARLLGITLPENFRRPYLAGNIREFWDRWHITLSHWVRDYVFSPTARALFHTRLRRWPAAIAVLSYLLTFLVVGAWHGTTAAFLVWGLYHGLLLALFHLVRLKTPVRIADHPLYRSRVARGLAVAVTFGCVTLGWVPFMLPLGEAQKLLALMFGVWG